MWLDQQTDWDIELTNQSVNNAHPIEKTKQKKNTSQPIAQPVPIKKKRKKLFGFNCMTSGPYWEASQQDRWAEYHNKKLNRASQHPDGLQTDKCRVMKW